MSEAGVGIGGSDEQMLKVLSGEGDKSVENVKYATGIDVIWNNWFTRLFFTRKFILHRLVGLFFLIQYTITLGLYVLDYERFKGSIFIWMLPLTGVLQSVTAIYTFTFLPRKADPGITFFSDKTALSYFFIIENSFFEMLLAFQWMYYDDRFYHWFQQLLIPELMFVFLPYFFRPFWPKTRMRDSMQNLKGKTELNRQFYILSTYAIKVFYVFAKHYIGYYLNYIRFLDRIDEHQQYLVYGVLVTSSYATTIAIFLHTLKFKGYLGPRTATLVYMFSYLVIGYYFMRLFSVFVSSVDMALLTLVGLMLNFTSPQLQNAWQIVMLVLCMCLRSGVDVYGTLGIDLPTFL